MVSLAWKSGPGDQARTSLAHVAWRTKSVIGSAFESTYLNSEAARETRLA